VPLLDFRGAPHGGSHRLLPEWNSQARIVPVLIIDHSQVGSSLGTYYYFRDQTGIESHFSVRGRRSGAQDGHIWQFMNTDRVAEANRQANRFPNGTGAISIETEDDGDPDHQPWTRRQLASLRWLHDKLVRTHPTIPRRRATSATGPGARGLGYHTMFGAPSPWTPASKTCPGKPVRVRQWQRELLPAFLRRTQPEEDDVLNDDDREWIHAQLQHFGMLLMAGQTGSVFNSRDLREFHFQRWLTNPEVREQLLDRMTQVLYRVLKGQNSAFNEVTFPDQEPQENIRDLAARLEALQRSVDDLRAQLGPAAPAPEPPPPP
jgi:N-acetyl-anhydromuramyl-L-alanine amidase AmpD